ncbi:MurR/RpiR family transcriptional regulator [Pseudonocardia sp. MH-G8]|uniref:MurR/RpiR family transcriptional regulator n=1 Tax=Pseudonocardia sp. MH-G8 TaxID=1854588 RepID=UPI000BA18C78|nr:MurR/RpiR family transcriptional regulator [Pseudonocardia sp. MH-G8]OZM81406.1 RpiR family transcriptional regulator [Pseudonocardia sp. MH-G8]
MSSDPARGVLVRIRAVLPSLRPAQRRVAEAVLHDPAGSAQLPIGRLAQQCATSAATVMRFCRSAGFRGYPELRLALARETGREDAGDGAALSPDIDPGDSLAEIVAKIAFTDAAAVQDTAATLDLDALAAAVSAVGAARRVDVYGLGASGFVGQDLQQKLHRIGLLAFAWPDPHAALTSAALLDAESVAIAISHTGTTTDTVDALRVARESGATTIAVTNFAPSPLTACADLVLATAARETTFRSGAMASRIAQLAVIDCLFVGVAQRSYDRTIDRLTRTHRAVQSRRGG